MAYLAPKYTPRPADLWYHALYGHVPGHIQDFICRPNLGPDDRVTLDHVRLVQPMLRYLEPDQGVDSAFAIANLSPDDMRPPGRGGLGIISSLRLPEVRDHAGRRGAIFAHAILTADQPFGATGLYEILTGFIDRVATEGPAWYKEYYDQGEPQVVPDLLGRYLEHFDALDRIDLASGLQRFAAKGTPPHERIVLVYPESVGPSVMACAARLGAMLFHSDARWISISTGYDDEIQKLHSSSDRPSLSIRFLSDRDAPLASEGALVQPMNRLPAEDGELAALLGLMPVVEPAPSISLLKTQVNQPVVVLHQDAVTPRRQGEEISRRGERRRPSTRRKAGHGTGPRAEVRQTEPITDRGMTEGRPRIPTPTQLLAIPLSSLPGAEEPWSGAPSASSEDTLIVDRLPEAELHSKGETRASVPTPVEPLAPAAPDAVPVESGDGPAARPDRQPAPPPITVSEDTILQPQIAPDPSKQQLPEQLATPVPLTPPVSEQAERPREQSLPTPLLPANRNRAIPLLLAVVVMGGTGSILYWKATRKDRVNTDLAQKPSVDMLERSSAGAAKVPPEPPPQLVLRTKLHDEEQPPIRPPAVKPPAVKQPAAKQPAAKQPAAKQPAAKQPAVKQPVPKQSAPKQSAARQPQVKKPAPAAAEEPRPDCDTDLACRLDRAKNQSKQAVSTAERAWGEIAKQIAVSEFAVQYANGNGHNIQETERVNKAVQKVKEDANQSLQRVYRLRRAIEAAVKDRTEAFKVDDTPLALEQALEQLNGAVADVLEHSKEAKKQAHIADLCSKAPDPDMCPSSPKPEPK